MAEETRGWVRDAAGIVSSEAGLRLTIKTLVNQRREETLGLRPHALDTEERVEVEGSCLVDDREEGHLVQGDAADGDRVGRALYGEDVVVVHDGVHADASGEGEGLLASAALEGGALGGVELALLCARLAPGLRELEGLGAGVEDDTDRLGRGADCVRDGSTSRGCA